MTTPNLSRGDKARAGLVQALRLASDSGKPLAAIVARNLQLLWEQGGRLDETRSGPRPEFIAVRQHLVVRPTSDPDGPLLPKLIKSRGLQLKMLLLLWFDAQCRQEAGKSVRNVRRVTSPRAGDPYLPWRQLVLAESIPTRGTDRGPAELRARQITEALRALEDLHLIKIPREPGGTRRIYNFAADGKTTWQLHSEDSTSDVHRHYTVPRLQLGVIRIPREFFTNLWVFALTDTEIAAYLTLTFLRWRFPSQYASRGVYLRADHRRDYFQLTRATWRATELLHRFRLVDRAPSPGVTSAPATSATSVGAGRTARSCPPCSPSTTRP